MGCCKSKKQVEEDDPPSEPPKEEPKKVEEPKPEPKKEETQRGTIETGYVFQQPTEKEVEDKGPRKETITPSESESPSATGEIAADEPSITQNLIDPEEECTPLEGPSIADGGKAEVEPIEPVQIPITTKVDKMGPGDKNHVIVRSSLFSNGTGNHLDPNDVSGQPNPNLTGSSTYYTDTTGMTTETTTRSTRK